MSSWKVIARVDDIFGEEPCAVDVDGIRVALFNVQGCIHAIEDRCPHDKVVRLSDGYVDNGTIECPIHQSRFDIRTGKVLCAPAQEDVRLFATRVEDGKISIELDPKE
jgi:nitrite reductase/ring-hydroxylating ferredoxin subunit